MKFKIPFEPKPIKSADLGRWRIFTLRGPRQVGKTRFLKRVEQEYPHLNPVYEGLDIVRTDRELVAVIRRLIKEKNPRLLLLDEISSVPRWQKAIKYMADKGEIAGIDLILTGSSATDIRRGAERLPGRRGPEVSGGWDRILLPLSFSQYVLHAGLMAAEEIDLLRSRLADPEALPADLHHKLGEAFRTFLTVGGFPPAVLAMQAGEGPPHRTMMGIIRSDFEKRKKSRIILDQVLARLNATAGTAMTWEAFAKTVTATKVVARQYVDELCENYLLADIECIDLARQSRAPRKPRKLVWIDPIVPQAIAADGIGTPVAPPPAVEAVVAFELVRRHESTLWEGLNQLRRVYLWRDSRGNEIDFVLWEKEKTAIEVKWQSEISEWDARPLAKTFGGGIVLSKDCFHRFGRVRVLPIPWFLLVIDVASPAELARM